MIGPFVKIAQSVVYRINPVLPQAYDDSLSYFEVLGRLQKKINDVITQVNLLIDAVEELDGRLTVVERDVGVLKEQVTEITNKVNDFENRITALENRPIAMQSDWDEEDTTSMAYIKNKPEHIGVDIATTETAGIVKPDGVTIDVELDGTISVDGENVDISHNQTITDIIDGTTEIDISNNHTITDIIDGTTEIDISNNTTIENIIDGTTPVPTSYELPTMSANEKGGAKLGSGLIISNDALSVDGDNIDISHNQTITDIIDGTTEIDISNNSTITDIVDGTTEIDISNNSTITDIVDGTTEIDISNNSTITDIVDGTTPIDISGNSTITDILNGDTNVLVKDSFNAGSFTLVSDDGTMADLDNCNFALQSVGEGIIAQLSVLSANIPAPNTEGKCWLKTFSTAEAQAFMSGKTFTGKAPVIVVVPDLTSSALDVSKIVGRIDVSRINAQTNTITVKLYLLPYTISDVSPQVPTASGARTNISSAISNAFTFVTNLFLS